MNNNSWYNILLKTIVILALISVSLTITEVALNAFGLWMLWNLLAYFIGLIMFPLCIVLETIFICIIFVKHLSNNIFIQKKYLVVAIISLIATIFTAVLFYAFVATWWY